MPKVYCAAMDCEFNGDDGKCHAKSIALSAHSVMTVWEGRQEFNKCKTTKNLRLQKISRQCLKNMESTLKAN